MAWYSFLEEGDLITWSNRPYFYEIYQKYREVS